MQSWLCRRQLQNSLARTTSTRSSLNKAALPRQKKKLAKNSFSPLAFQQPAWTSSFSATAWFSRVGPKQLHNQNFLHRELSEEELADKTFDKKSCAATSLHTRTSARHLQKNQLEEENFTENSFEALCLNSFPGTACTEALLQQQLLQQQLPAEPSNRTAFQTAACQERASDQKPFSQQLGEQDLQTGSFTHSSLTEETFSNSSLAETPFRTEASRRPPLTTTASMSTALTTTPLRRPALQTRA